jgi:hypothetical protein
VFDHEGQREFLGMPVLPIADHATIEFDLIIVATLDRSGRQLQELLDVGVPGEKLFPLRQEPIASPNPKRHPISVRARSTNGKH